MMGMIAECGSRDVVVVWYDGAGLQDKLSQG